MALYEDIAAIVGKERISDNRLDLICYSHDLAPFPDELIKGFGGFEPDIVVRPENISQVADIMRYAYQRSIPVTPRGGGSWGMGGVLPIDGGIVIDLCGMNRIIELNHQDEYVTLETGVEWKRLSDILQKSGFQVASCPTSAPVATIGGYISTGGSSGIGVSRYGPVGEQVISLKVVLPDGKIIQTNPWDSWIFVGSEGTLGLICEITLKIFKRFEMKHMLFGFDNLAAGIEAIVKTSEIRPYYFTFMDKRFVKFLNEKGYHLPEKEITLAITFEINKSVYDKLQDSVNNFFNVSRYSDEMAEEEWKNRYKIALSFKSLGPTMLSQEIRLPARFLGKALSKWKTVLSDERVAFKGTGSDNGAVNVMPVIMTDERDKKDFFKATSYTHEIAQIGKKYHGSVYGIGLFNSYQMSQIHGESLEVMREIKRELDPRNILNPYKTIESRIPGFILIFMFRLMKFAPSLFIIFARLTNYLPAVFVKTVIKLLQGKK